MCKYRINILLKAFLFVAMLLVPCKNIVAQKTIFFIAADGVEVAADIYLKDKDQPFIILLHDGGYSRGEYVNLAGRLLNLNYNCLAVDLRYGAKSNGIKNITAENAGVKDKNLHDYHAIKDVEAAIDYIYRTYHKQVILFGAGPGASLALAAASGNFKVNGVVALSPGEYFMPYKNVKNQLQHLEIPILVAGTQTDKPYIMQFVENVPAKMVHTCFVDKNGSGIGNRVFAKSHPTHDKYWFELLLYFKGLSAK